MAIRPVDVLRRGDDMRGNMKRLLCSTLLVAAAALAGCEQETITPKGPYDPNANLTNSSGPIALPPAITASKAYRCKDNSLLYIDWYSDGSARVKKDRGELGTQVPPPAEGQPSPLGTAQGSSVTHEGKTCHI